MNLRLILSSILEYTGVNAVALARRRRSLTVLCYHRVLDMSDASRATTHPALVTSTHIFERQMEIIARRFNPVTLSEAIAWIDGHGAIPPRAVLVTFDDGWSDTYTKAYPVMKRLGIPGVVFLATGLIGTDEPQWVDAVYQTVAARSGPDAASREVERLKAMPSASRLAEISSSRSRTSGRSPLNLTWAQVEEMAANGFEFGSHTRSHLILPREPEAEVKRELQLSAEDIQLTLGSRPASFAYPDGQFDDSAVRLVAQSGYTHAFTCDEGLVSLRSRRHALPRLGIHDGVSSTPRGDFSRATFATYLAGTIPWRYRRRV